MNRSLVAPKFFFSLALCAALAGGVAQAQPAKEYQPEVGQAGKDVVWVPTPQALVDKMLDMAKLTPKDYLIDLGSGDGRTVITATKSGSEKNATLFGRYWVEALRDPSADTDKNETVSALEAFHYAQTKTAAFFTEQKRLAT